ncbi:acyl-CoA synthetase family member 4 [Lingula anatina]|uniref:Acyl-CoA synthetase family member 4 n=1 Tax=Lingula anatina TaxID=7574 RepID=A0A2R2MQU1_LINAN|nr:acyl-CoA synthetase family member 4 [Lingula anatina]|eukprot:XP_023932610.1 acyl-CoA synthetase family member 4 [Lingula anatina]
MQSLHALFELSTQQQAHSTAVVFDDGLQLASVTYSQLNRHSLAVSELLKEAGCSPGEIVGVMVNPSVLMPAVLIGIMKAGCAYLPIDPTLGGTATQETLQRCQARFLFADASVHQKILSETKLTEFKTQCSTLQKPSFSLFHIEGAPVCPCPIQDLAYVITTSGTTGIPKLVYVPHSCIMPNITDLKCLLKPCPGDVIFMASPLTFDPSVVEMFLALGSGATLLIVPHAVKAAPKLCEEVLCGRNKVTILQATPTFLSRFGNKVLQSSLLSQDTSLRALILGGESFPSPQTLRTWRAEGNQTKMYNIYGITEVSCWAMLKEITEEELGAGSPHQAVSLGHPMLDTEVQVLDTSGVAVQSGEGQLFVGGSKRRCFVSEMSSPSRLDLVAMPTMHATGDWVRLEEDGRIVYQGRKDEQIKRHGKRLNLVELTKFTEQQIPGLYCVTLNRENGLYLFIQFPGDWDIVGLIEKVEKRISEHLPPHYKPDIIHMVQEIPVTRHGKVDKEALLAEFEKNRQYTSGSTVKQVLQEVWKDVIGHLPDVKDRWMERGGNSLMAVHMTQTLETVFQSSFPLLLDSILHKTFSEIEDYISNEINHGSLIVDVQSRDKRDKCTNAFKEHPCKPLTAGSLITSTSMKNEIQNVMSNTENFSEISQVGKKRKLQNEETDFVQMLNGSGTKHPVTGILSIQRGSKYLTHCNESTGAQSFQKLSSPRKPSLKRPEIVEGWKYDTGKCVDASPLLVLRDRGQGQVFIGSHSHRVSAIDLHTGNVHWDRELGDRIESSPCLSACGNYVIVGCYNHAVYVLEALSGDIWWQFKTSGPVKSSPYVNPVNALVYVGSHDHHLYGLDIKSQQCAWKRDLGEGSVFSSPVVSPDSCHVYAATLAGTVFKMSADTGRVNWMFYDKSDTKPFFSSPALTQEGVCIDAPTLRWKMKTSSQVYSTPFVFPVLKTEIVPKLTDNSNEIPNTSEKPGNICKNVKNFETYENFVCVCATNGSLYLLALEDGTCFSQYNLPGEVFSSPVVFGDKILVGCRDDYIYCKVDKEALLAEFEKSRQYTSGSTVKQVLQEIWKDVIGHLPDVKDRWMERGGNSLMAVHMTQTLETVFQSSFPLLLDSILHKTSSEIEDYISNEINHGSLIVDVQSRDKRDKCTNAFKEHPFKPLTAGSLITSTSMKNEIQNVMSNTENFSEISQVGKKRKLQNEETDFVQMLNGSGTKHPVTGILSIQRGSKYLTHCNESTGAQSFQKLSSPRKPSLKRPEVVEGWKYDTGKCVDASPLLVLRDRGQGQVFIGSHSHRVSAIDLHTGNVHWDRELGDRIESSPCLSSCGNYVIVGCYNHAVYVLDALSGDIWWQFKTSGPVKSSPCINPVNALVYVGSHDHHLYGLDIKSQQCAWKRDLGGGSVFSSPVVSPDSCNVYAATLAGTVVKLSADMGKVNWMFYDKSDTKPFFSSPALTQEGVCIGCVNGKLYHIDYNGKMLWSYSTSGPIFSSPCIHQSDDRKTELIIFGSHDHYVYCLPSDAPTLRWKMKTSSQVYSTPFVFPVLKTEIVPKLIDNSNEIPNTSEKPGNICKNVKNFETYENFVCICATNGSLYLLALEDGTCFSQYNLPGEVFSSPVVFGDKILVGCRDDYIYCLQMRSSS